MCNFLTGNYCLELKVQQIDKLIDEVAGFQQHDCAEKGISFHAHVDYTGQLVIDTDKMHRVLNNLINNAKEAIMEKGTAQQGRISLHVSSRNGFAEFRIADNGPGIHPDIRPRLFEPFITRGKKNGTGLGLAIVDKIIKDHGGTVEIESCCDAGGSGHETGTTFLVSIPLSS
ncbi:MAG: HAMP domain-containing sensor histidine kinase [Desulfobulbaceae bacterium]|nr:HAMP domain-containing sensor histidine kinase [Desulfobulbaceae bacterium]